VAATVAVAGTAVSVATAAVVAVASGALVGSVVAVASAALVGSVVAVASGALVASGAIVASGALVGSTAGAAPAQADNTNALTIIRLISAKLIRRDNICIGNTFRLRNIFVTLIIFLLRQSKGTSELLCVDCFFIKIMLIYI
jgi:hypothetical protein